jgi:hypothetical protein
VGIGLLGEAVAFTTAVAVVGVVLAVSAAAATVWQVKSATAS